MCIEHTTHGKNLVERTIVHPYFLRQHCQQWHIVGHAPPHCQAWCKSLEKIVSIERDHDTAFVPGHHIAIEEFHQALFKLEQ